jgi:hypothetical protein
VGDFEWMIKQPQYSDSLFIFNDNEEEFTAQSCSKGSGNAVIRPYQCKNPPRATGISTGSYKKGKVSLGYSKLDTNAKNIIDQGIGKFYRLLLTGRYTRVFFSSDKNGGLGTAIFQVGEDVKEYIVNEITDTVNTYNMQFNKNTSPEERSIPQVVRSPAEQFIPQFIPLDKKELEYELPEYEAPKPFVFYPETSKGVRPPKSKPEDFIWD